MILCRTRDNLIQDDKYPKIANIDIYIRRSINRMKMQKDVTQKTTINALRMQENCEIFRTERRDVDFEELSGKVRNDFFNEEVCRNRRVFVCVLIARKA